MMNNSNNLTKIKVGVDVLSDVSSDTAEYLNKVSHCSLSVWEYSKCLKSKEAPFYVKDWSQGSLIVSEFKYLLNYILDSVESMHVPPSQASAYKYSKELPTLISKVNFREGKLYSSNMARIGSCCYNSINLLHNLSAMSDIFVESEGACFNFQVALYSIGCIIDSLLIMIEVIESSSSSICDCSIAQYSQDESMSVMSLLSCATRHIKKSLNEGIRQYSKEILRSNDSAVIKLQRQKQQNEFVYNFLNSIVNVQYNQNFKANFVKYLIKLDANSLFFGYPELRKSMELNPRSIVRDPEDSTACIVEALFKGDPLISMTIHRSDAFKSDLQHQASIIYLELMTLSGI